MQWYRNLRMAAKIILPVGLMLVLALGTLAWQIRSKATTAIAAVAERELAATAGKYGNLVKGLFEVPLDATQAMANSLAYALKQKNPVSRELLINMLTGLETGEEAFLASGSIWESGGLDGADAANANGPGSDAAGRFVPYISAGKLEPLAGFEQADYYLEPKSRGRIYMSKPSKYPVNGKEEIVATASAPVQVDGSFRGLILIDVSLSRIAQEVAAIEVYTTGWAAIISEDGTIIADKQADLITKNHFDTGRVGQSDKLKTAMRKGEPFLEIYQYKGQESFFYYFPITLAQTKQTWYFVVSAPMTEVLAAATEISSMTLIISGIALVLSLLVMLVIVRSGVKPVGVLAGVAKEVAGGNLRVQIDTESFGGEMRDLATALKEMLVSLLENISKAEAMSSDAQAQTVKAEQAMREAEAAKLAAENAKREGMLAAAGQLESVVHIISTASEELAAQIEQSERGSADQAAKVGETATAMEEMNSTVLEVARSASSASEMAGRAKGKAEDGAKVVQAAVNGIRNVQTVSLALKEDMGKLSEQAQSISNIMGVISDIADQTNLLALNAAIEAARAGEAGRGFAVVADEVRKLAEKTMTSTTDVGNAIKSIQGSVRQSIEQVDRAVGLIDTATEQSNKSGEALGEIVGMVDQAADQVRAIATAGEQQSATSEEINRSIGDINSIATQTSQAMHEASKAVSDLAAQAHALSGLIEDMKRG